MRQISIRRLFAWALRLWLPLFLSAFVVACGSAPAGDALSPAAEPAPAEPAPAEPAPTESEWTASDGETIPTIIPRSLTIEPTSPATSGATSSGLGVTVATNVPAAPSPSPAPNLQATESSDAAASAEDQPQPGDEPPLPPSESSDSEAPTPQATANSVSQAESPQTVEQMIEAALAAIEPGTILFNPPAEMTVGQTERIEVRLAKGSPPEAELAAGLSGAGEPRIEDIQVGTRMRVSLTGEDFEIEPLNTENQVIGPDGFTQWAWDVTPTWHGERALRLLVTVRVSAGDTEEVRDLPVKEEFITVAVNPVYTVTRLGATHWPILLLVLVVLGVLPLAARRFTRGRPRAAGPAQPSSPPEPVSPPPDPRPVVTRPISAGPALPTGPTGADASSSPQSATSFTILEPETLIHARYRVERLIGKGGMGAVYAAFDLRLNTTIALKQTLVTDERLVTAFQHEARLLARLHHQALPKVSDYFSDERGQFLVMEYFSGDDLGQLLGQRASPLPLARVLAWADQILDALHYLHTQTPPIIHRDIKPQNLKLTENGQIVLLDFGLAKGLPPQSQAEGLQSVYGYTPSYAPPEQVEGSGTEPRSDLYALAATVYHLLTNTRPPGALTRISAHRNTQRDLLHPAHTLNPAVPVAVSALLQRTLALDVNQRPSDAVALRQALQAVADGQGSGTIVLP